MLCRHYKIHPICGQKMRRIGYFKNAQFILIFLMRANSFGLENQYVELPIHRICPEPKYLALWKSHVTNAAIVQEVFMDSHVEV